MSRRPHQGLEESDNFLKQFKFVTILSLSVYNKYDNSILTNSYYILIAYEDIFMSHLQVVLLNKN